MRVRDPLLGTRCEIEALAPTAETSDAAEIRALDEVVRLESVFSVYDESSDLSVLRRTELINSDELAEVWSLALEWHRLTDGVFHPAAQPLIDLWNESARLDTLPSDAALTEVVSALDPEDYRHIDFNALAKGWIADRALDTAFGGDESPDGAWLSLGGDLVHRGDGSVVVGIEDPGRPYDNVAPMATIEVCNEALATSGTVHRYWTIEGKRFSRVLDPRTGRPVERVRQASVVAHTAATADVLATVALILEPEETFDLVASQNAACLLVTKAGDMLQSTDRFKRG